MTSRRAWVPLRALRAATGGAVAIQMALMFIAIAGFVSLGTEVGVLYFIARQMQSAADAAVLGAVTAQSTGRPVNYTTEALSIAASAGFVNGQDGTSVTVASPPPGGTHAGQDDVVEVTISQPQTLLLASLVNANPITITVHADATRSGYGACVLTVKTTGTTFSLSNNVVVNQANCDVAVNSSAARAISLGSHANLTVRNVFDVGGESLGGGAVINASGVNRTGANPTVNPYASYSVPSFGGCEHTGYAISSGTVTLLPGVYCNGMSLSGTAVVTLSSGIYYVDGGQFRANGARVTGNGVTIVLTRKNWTGYATASFSGGSITNFTAMTTGQTAGLAFFQDPLAPTANSDLSNGASATITGALYFPTQNLTFSGGTSSGSACTQIVAYTLTIDGNTTLGANCGGIGVLPIGSGGAAELIE